MDAIDSLGKLIDSLEKAGGHKYTSKKWVNGRWQYEYGSKGGEGKKLSREQASSEIKKLNDTQRQALGTLWSRVRKDPDIAAGREGVETHGIRRDTLKALERRGFIRRGHVRSWTERNRRSGKQHTYSTWVTYWNVETGTNKPRKGTER